MQHYSSSPEFDRKSFKLKPEETLKSNPSFRVYYGDHVPSAIPFTWETIPGTPKHSKSSSSSSSSRRHSYSIIPPLTPPPSYYTNKNLSSSSKNRSRSRFLLHNLLRRLNLSNKEKSNSDSSSSISSSSISWSSSVHSSFSDPITDTTSGFQKQKRPRRRRFLSWNGSSSSSVDDDPRGETRCFRIGKDK